MFHYTCDLLFYLWIFWLRTSSKAGSIVDSAVAEMADQEAQSPGKAPPSSPRAATPAKETPAKEATPKKASVGAKAKAKGKSKAAAKPKAKASCPKKPAAHVKQPSMKKPVAAPSALAKTSQESKPKAGGAPLKRPAVAPKAKAVKPWFTGLEEEEEQEQDESTEQPEEEKMEEDPEIEVSDFDMDQTKDRSKNNKFLKLLRGGSLPQWLVDEWNKTKTMTAGRRERQRQIVNNAMEHKAGHLVLNVDKPAFQSMKETWTKTASKEKELCHPLPVLLSSQEVSP